MGQNARDTRPNLKPVKKIELGEKNTTLRFVLLIALILIAAVSFTIFLVTLLSKGDGWTEIEADTDTPYYSGEVFLGYNLGATDKSATAEYKELALLYGECLKTAHQSFTASESIVGLANMRAINESKNEDISVPPLLYNAIKAMVNDGERLLYMAPIYSLYYNLFQATDDAIAKTMDPSVDPELNAELMELVAFINDPSHVNLVLVDDESCTVRLCVSDAYGAYLEAREYDTVISLGIFELAFVVDYVSDTLLEKGYTSGIVSSYDGFTRNLGLNASVSAEILDLSAKGEPMRVSRMNYSGARAFVSFRNYPIADFDALRFYVYNDGRVVSTLLDTETGKNANVLSFMDMYSDKKSCAEIALIGYDHFVSNVLDGKALNDLTYLGVYTVYAMDKTVFFNDQGLKSDDALQMILQGYNKSYLFE